MAMHAITEMLILQEKRMNHWKSRIVLQGGKKRAWYSQLPIVLTRNRARRDKIGKEFLTCPTESVQVGAAALPSCERTTSEKHVEILPILRRPTTVGIHTPLQKCRGVRIAVPRRAPRNFALCHCTEAIYI